jgi:hypothetical protein
MEIASQAIPAIAGNETATPLVRADQEMTMGADFSNLLEGFRQRSAAVEQAGRESIAKPGAPQSATDRSIRQLSELYTYAVDMQVMVRTGGQLTSGLRQLITGQ